MYYVYVLKSSVVQKSYVGITNDIQRRLVQHNSEYHRYTKRYLPWEVIHREEFSERNLAREREKYLKSASGRKWMQKNIF